MDQPVNNTSGSDCNNDDSNMMTAGDSNQSSPSSVTTETRTGGSNESSTLVEGGGGDDDEFAFLNALTGVDFWTDPFVADFFCDPTQTGSFTPLLSDHHQSDYFTMDTSCDALLWTQNNVYDQYSGLFS